MTTIKGSNFFIEHDFEETLMVRGEEIKRNLDGEVIIEKERRSQVLQIVLEKHCEFVLNLTLLDSYTVCLNQCLAVCGEGAIKLPYSTSNTIFIFQQHEKNEIIAGKGSSYDQKFKLENNTLIGQGFFTILAKFEIPCVLLSLESHNFKNTLLFEELKHT